MALQFTGQSVFLALGKAKKATFFSLLRKAFIVVPLTILLPKIGNLGVDGVSSGRANLESDRRMCQLLYNVCHGVA